MDILTIAKVIIVIAAAPVRTAKPLPPLPSATTTVASQTTSADPCDVPFTYDLAGIKHYVASCLAHEREEASGVIDCTVPYRLDARGHHQYIDACLDSDPCAVPYSIGANGAEHFALSCM